MARVATHLSVWELAREYRAAKDARAVRHYQAIWLLAKGHTVPEVAETTSFGTRWLEQLVSRYNAGGPSALGDRRRHNGRAPTILKPELLERLPAAARGAAARRWAVDGAQGGGLDGRPARAREGGAATRLGGAQGDRLDDTGAASTASAGGEGGRAGGI